MTVSASDPDWSRERPRRWWDPPRRLIRSIRRYQSARGPLAGLRRKYWALQHRFWTVVTGAELHLNTQFSGGLMMTHPNGIVVHPEARIGPNCLLFQQVTLGMRTGRTGLPVLGGGVEVGSGAKVLGPISVGDHAVIGANAVVLTDVPAGAAAVGIPARIIERKADTDT